MNRLANLKRLGFSRGCSMRRRQLNDIAWQPSRSSTRKPWVSIPHGSRSTIFMSARAGLPAPFAFLGFVAAQTSRIRLGTGIVTLPLENPIRVAEDAAVLDLLSNGRFELGVGTGGNPSAFAAFGFDSAQRAEIFAGNLDIVRNALAGAPLAGGDTLYPARAAIMRPDLAGDVFRKRRDEGRQSRRRLVAVKNAAANQRSSRRIACRDSASHHRRLSRRIAPRARAADHGIAQYLRR